MRRGLSGYKCLCLPNFKGSTCSIEITTKKKTKTTKTSIPCLEVNCVLPMGCKSWIDGTSTMKDGNYYEFIFLFFHNELV